MRRIRNKELYDKAYRERRWDLLEMAYRAAKEQQVWEGGSGEKQNTLFYISQLLKMRPPYNPYRPNHWYWRGGKRRSEQ